MITLPQLYYPSFALCAATFLMFQSFNWLQYKDTTHRKQIKRILKKATKSVTSRFQPLVPIKRFLFAMYDTSKTNLTGVTQKVSHWSLSQK